jgi:NitT/TauT family transport system substrate-binding protein
MKRITVHGFLVLALWWIGAQPAAAQTTTLHIGFNGFYGAAPLYVAQDAGIFRKHGFMLELVFIAGGSLSTQALIGKSLDLLQTGGPPFLNAYVRGARLKIIAGVTNILPYVLITSGRITNSEQLRGKKIAISRFGSNTDFAARFLLQREGLRPDIDVALLQVGNQANRIAAVETNNADAAMLTPPMTLQARKLGMTLLLDASKLNIPYSSLFFVARRPYLVGIRPAPTPASCIPIPF